jgi:NTP pyrophosphatase (non-canonical NTP hydrolase)
MLEKIEDYQKFAIRTMKQESVQRMMLHCTMGMVGELGELIEVGGLDSMKRSLELGDCLWYAANMCQILGLEIHEIIAEAEARDREIIQSYDFLYMPPDIRAVIWAAQLTDIIKKEFFYGKEYVRGDVISILKKYIVAIVDLTYLHSLTVFGVARNNIAKLEARYPNLVFNADDAVNRNYEAEEEATSQPVD